MPDTTATDFTFVEDHDENQFYIILPDGTDTEWSGNDEIAMCDDGARTYFATNCEDFPGMQPGVVYSLGSAVPTTVQDYTDLPEDEDEDPADAPAGEEEEDEEEDELEAEET